MKYLDATTLEPHPDHHYRTGQNVAGETIVRCRDCNITLVPAPPLTLLERTSNPRLVPGWLEDAAALAGRELFAQTVCGIGPTDAQLEQARRQWDRSGPDSTVGRIKDGYIARGRQIVVACAGPFLDQLEQRDTELAAQCALRETNPETSARDAHAEWEAEQRALAGDDKTTP